ncbi:hypothetical protein VB780_22950 [Leptolyngbya sp. CCNP1308]|uniref:hypothetical protein n=1 Tax=Leptolyngbya sp. CCNP1308 TaxID=3110255 RepID=UPI002B1F19F1|nr:hypothetical protein [Leptolyngbya sp. CCNP1308]MEA5451456.1 hypothetical protein [Leptolyngbya sp. CCNP1308]
MPSVDILLAIAVPLGIWAMVLVFVLAVLLAVNDGVQRLRRLHQVPCFRCQYYTNSPYLKCPVHPLDAGSEAALCCTDYEPAIDPARSSHPKTRFRTVSSLLKFPSRKSRVGG